jgi:hypothetical protein
VTGEVDVEEEDQQGNSEGQEFDVKL